MIPKWFLETSVHTNPSFDNSMQYFTPHRFHCMVWWSLRKVTHCTTLRVSRDNFLCWTIQTRTQAVQGPDQLLVQWITALKRWHALQCADVSQVWGWWLPHICEGNWDMWKKRFVSSVAVPPHQPCLVCFSYRHKLYYIVLYQNKVKRGLFKLKTVRIMSETQGLSQHRQTFPKQTLSRHLSSDIPKTSIGESHRDPAGCSVLRGAPNSEVDLYTALCSWDCTQCPH